MTELKKEILRLGDILGVNSNMYKIITALINEYEDHVSINTGYEAYDDRSPSFCLDYIHGRQIVVPYEAIVLIVMIVLGIDKNLTTTQKGLHNKTIERSVAVNLSISKPISFLAFVYIMIKANYPIECFVRLFDKLEWLDDVTDEEIKFVINELNKFNSPDITIMFIRFIRDNTCNDMEEHIVL